MRGREVDPEGMGSMEEHGGVEGEEQKQKKNKNREKWISEFASIKKNEKKNWQNVTVNILFFFMTLEKSLCLTAIQRQLVQFTYL